MVTIDAYDFGYIVINGQQYHRDVKILGQRVIPNWWRKEGHYLQLVDLPELEEKPEAVVIGTGKYGRMDVDPEVLHRLEALAIPYTIAITDEAIQQFKTLSRKGKRVLGAFHLTC